MALRYSAIAATAALPFILSTAAAGPTATWVVDSYADFDKGEAKSALISSSGEVRAGYAAKRVDFEYTNSWSMISGKDGDLYIGTDDDGAIVRVRDGKASKFSSLPDVVAVVSLAQAADGTLYAGTMPGGQVWRVTADGKASKLATLKDAETIWALAVDASQSAVYAGTGPKGQLFRIDPKSGDAKVVFDTDDKRITALLAASDGSIWLGTSAKALVFRHDPKRNATRAMADFAGNEITAMAEWNGTALVAANDLQEPSTSGVKTKSAVDKALKVKKEGVKLKTPAADSKPGADSATPTGAEPPRKSARKGKGALFRVSGDGHLTQLHALTSTYFTDVKVGKDGAIYAASGEKGRIYLIEDDEAVSTVFDVDQRVIAQMAYTAKDGLWFATADSTALYRTEGAATKAEYLSDTFDAKAPAKFGTVVWRGTDVGIEFRTGNTAEPGKGWSGWQKPKNVRPGPTGATRGKLASPPGRYLQYRVTFTGQSSAIDHTQVYYLPHNKPTVVEKIELKLPKRSVKKLTTVQEDSKPRSPIIEMSWEIDNDDGDETVYEIHARREGEVRWRLLSPGDSPLTETKFKWNTETFPDGYYRVRVTASDRRANPNGSKRESHKTTALFVVDNQKPVVDGMTVRYPAASARASDALSAIAEAAFSVDDGPWHVVGSSDGLFDDLSEILEMELPAGLPSGVHTLAIRVADEAGNVASTSTSFRTP